MRSARQATKFLRRDTTPSQFLLFVVDLQKARRQQHAGRAANQNARQLVQLDLLNHSRARETATCDAQAQHFLQQ